MNKAIYIMRVDGVWSGYIPRKHHAAVVTARPDTAFIDFIKDLQEDYPKYRMRCVINKGLERHIRLTRGGRE